VVKSFLLLIGKMFDTFFQVVINVCRTAFNIPLETDIIRKQKKIISWYDIVHLIICCASDKCWHQMQSAK